MKRFAQQLKWGYLNLRVLARYGTLSPQIVSLPRSRHKVSVNPTDMRARKKLIADGVRGKLPRNQRFWRSACEEFPPSVAIDVGVNYGECLFSVEYPRETRLVGIEANPELTAHLEQSRNLHPNRRQIEIFAALADSQSEGTVPFFIDRDSSGGSTAAVGMLEEAPEKYLGVDVPRVCLDEILAPSLAPGIVGPLLFKIDVEGYERQVLEGMRRTLDAQVDMVGLIEFDAHHLQAAGTDPADFWKFLQQHFEVFMFCERFFARDMTGLPYAAAEPDFAAQRYHTDLMLLRSGRPGRFDRFVRQWVRYPAAAA